MRDIIFRGKSKMNGKWYYGSLISIGDGIICHIIPIDPKSIEKPRIAGIMQSREVISDSVGEYTGKTDSKGEKVFEGDLVTNENAGCNLLVVFDNGKFALKPLIEEGNHPSALADIGQLEFMWVVGNIHDKTN